MLEQVCDFVHNYFVLEEHEGTFEVSNGAVSLPFLLDGQRFKVKGSALNDGIYTYKTDGSILNDDGLEAVEMLDETFTGTVYAMGVPRTFDSLVKDIADWQEANKAALNSPYTSESFGGYSYTKATGSGSNSGGSLTWQDVFRGKLNAYRKIA